MSLLGRGLQPVVSLLAVIRPRLFQQQQGQGVLGVRQAGLRGLAVEFQRPFRVTLDAAPAAVEPGQAIFGLSDALRSQGMQAFHGLLVVAQANIPIYGLEACGKLGVWRLGGCTGGQGGLQAGGKDQHQQQGVGAHQAVPYLVSTSIPIFLRKPVGRMPPALIMIASLSMTIAFPSCSSSTWASVMRLTLDFM